ncbi:hypothetical protein [Mycobacterium sp. URHB0044]|uniref:hypothetical protein n=1 Tax=Mycobacterium sp. URHB0044 TaxID=1380386 RepID=UPI00056C4D65|nr:hypothetical protein [Mycobacterium sp. URHB0044]
MLRSSAIVVAVAATLLSSPGPASAEPAVPQPGTACAASLVGALTWPADTKTPLQCAQPGRWEPVDNPYPISDRWVSYGPVMTLHGQGRANPTLLSGAWTATPLDGESRCAATQTAVVRGAPIVAPAGTAEGEPGQPLSLEVVPTLVTIEMSGNCLWQKVDQGDSGPGSGW